MMNMRHEDEDYEFNAAYDGSLGLYTPLDPAHETWCDVADADEEWKKKTPAEKFAAIAASEKYWAERRAEFRHAEETSVDLPF